MSLFTNIAQGVGTYLGKKAGEVLKKKQQPAIDKLYSSGINTPQGETLPKPTPPPTPTPTPQNNIAMSSGGVRAPAPPPPAPTPQQQTMTQLAQNQAQAQSAPPSADELARQQLLKEQQSIQFQPADFTSVAGGEAPKPKMATVVNRSTGERKAVEVGSQAAQEAFGQGFVLETKTPQGPVPEATIPADQTPEEDKKEVVEEPAPEDDTKAQIDEIRGLLLQALNPSAAEQAKQEELDKLRTDTGIAVAGQEGMGLGLTAGQVSGRQGALIRTAAAQEMPLQAELDRLEGARQAALQAGNQQLAFLMEDQKMALQEQIRQEEQQRGDQQQLQALALQAAQAGASPEQIQGILSSTDFGQALSGASEFLYQPSELLSVEDAQKLGVPYGTTQAEAASMGITPQEEQDMLGGLNSEQISIMQNIQSQVRQDPDVKDFIEVRNGFERVQTGANRNDGVGDLAIVNGYARMLDPGGVVRPSEFDTVEEAQGFFERMLNTKDKIFDGSRLRPEKRQQFAEAAKELYTDRLDDHQNSVEFYTNQAEAFGIPTELVLRDFGSSATGGESSGGGIPQLNQSYGSIDAMVQNQPEFEPIIRELTVQYPEASDADILQIIEGLASGGGGSGGLFTDDLSRSVNGLGSLSEKFESGGDPGIIGYDSTGGYSYGAYQLAHNNAKRYVDQSKYANEFSGIPFNSQQFRNKWKEVAQRDPEGFKADQKAYIGKTHYEPQLQKIQNETGLDITRLSPAMQDVIWSTAVQHGANTNIIVNAIKQSNKTTSEAELINKIYDLRWSGGQQFRSSTQQVKNSVKNRFDQERQIALSQVNNTFA